MENRQKKIKNIPITITNIIIAINILAYILCVISDRNLIEISPITLAKYGANNPILVGYYHQYYRLFTCMFLHSGIVHIACNMYSLYFIGNLIENIYGKIQFIFIYIVSGIGCSILSYVFENNISSVSIGASGAIFGLLGAFLFFAIKERNRLPKSVINNISVIIILNLAIGASSKRIDNYGHIGGLITGIIVSILVYYINISIRKRKYQNIY